MPVLFKAIYKPQLKLFNEQVYITNTSHFPNHTKAKFVSNISNFASPCSIVLSLKETERERETERDRDRETERERERETAKEREREAERERGRNREAETETVRQRQLDREAEIEAQRERERQRQRDRDRERETHTHKQNKICGMEYTHYTCMLAHIHLCLWHKLTFFLSSKFTICHVHYCAVD